MFLWYVGLRDLTNREKGFFFVTANDDDLAKDGDIAYLWIKVENMFLENLIHIFEFLI